MASEAILDLVQRIGLVVSLTDPDDGDAVSVLDGLFAQVPAESGEPIDGVVESCRSTLAEVIEGESDDASAQLMNIAVAVEGLLDALSSEGETPEGDGGSEFQFESKPSGDDDSDFQFESESTGDDGLDFQFETEASSDENSDFRFEEPQETAEDFFDAGSQAEPAPVAAQVELTGEDLSLLSEFVDEANDGLAEADRVLVAVDRDGVKQGDVDLLFRVFHTIKGVAGFLALDDITILAHRTESLLDQMRENKLTLADAVLDGVFDATELMRCCVEATRMAIRQRKSPLSISDVPPMIKRLEALARGEESPEPAAPTEFMPDAEEVIAKATAQTKSAAAQSAQTTVGFRERQTVRVDLARVDSLVEQIGELAIVEAMVANASEIQSLSSPRIRNLMSQLTKISRDLQGLGMRMRMVPLKGPFQKIARMGRELSRGSGKQVRIAVEGESTEMDRRMVEQIGDPLVHIVRNSVDHGIESREGRKAAGKSPVAVIGLSAYHHGGNIVIELTDDGKGLDRERILSKAISKGLVDDGASLSDSEVWQLIFEPGFSTAQEVTQISGRGVGMDVVRRKVAAMRGRVQIQSKPGAGTTIKMILPLTTAIIDGMLVRVGEERFIIPTLAILESVQPVRSALGTAAGRIEFINVRGEIVPLIRLDRLLDVDGAEQDPTRALVVLVEAPGQKLGLVIDDVLAQQQVVIKSLGESLGHSEYMAGGAILSDGRVGLILNIEEIGTLVDRRAFRRVASDSQLVGADV